MRMKDKVAVVTGSTKGIGRAIAEMYAAEGARVVVTGRSPSGAAVVEKIVAGGGDAVFVPADLMREEDVHRLMDTAVERYGRLTTLVNNAAPTEHVIPGRGDGKIAELSNEDWERMLRAGLTGAVFWTAKYAIPHLAAAGGGSIINISSLAAVMGTTGVDAYAATKGALNSLTRQIAVGYASKGIRCNAIIVGSVLSGTRPTRPVWEAALRRVHLTRIGQPKDIAYACVWLGSDESEFVTGSLVTIDGGLSAKSPVPSLEDAAVEQAALGAGASGKGKN